MSTVRVGVGVFIQRPDGKFIVGLRKGSHGAGSIQLPGGHLEVGETFEDCGSREVLEETGITIPATELKFLTATNDIFAKEEKHYVTMFMLAKTEQDAEPLVMEPHKCEKWEWITWEELEEMGARADGQPNLFIPLQSLLAQRPDVRF